MEHAQQRQEFATIGYLGFVVVAFAHAFTLMLRRSRVILAAVITLLPVLLPVALVFLSQTEFVIEGNTAFVHIMEKLYVRMLAPVLALFFASMLVGEDVESQTIAYMLTRPTPRSAWVIGRYLAYCVLCGVLLLLSALLVFAGCLALPGFALTAGRVLLLAQYLGILALAVPVYGAFCLFLGAFFMRPVVYGVLLIFGWQRFALLIPGLVDFFTIAKYLQTLFPAMAEVRGRTIFERRGDWNFQKVAVDVGDVWAVAILAGIILVFLAITVYAVRRREFSATQAAGG